MNRDQIDWASMNIPQLFRKIFVPTLLGMLLTSTINIADGAFVGQGAGSDALAAVNIVAPFFLVTAGIGLMFGSGVSIVASVHLSQGRKKAACINVTQAFTVSFSIMLVVTLFAMLFPEQAARMLGSSERLMPYVKDYMRWVVPTLPFGVLMSIGLFVIRLDGSPVFAMLCNALPALLNVVLDYVFVFPMHMGIEGASLATGIAQTSFTLLIGLYMWRYARTIRFYKPKFTKKSIRLTLRNVGCQAKLGISSMIGELAIACMMFTGNLAFLKYLGEDGVAAFSVACYCFPFVFMIGNAIAQSAQPIISYNHGAGLPARVSQTFRLSIGMGLAFGLLAMLGGIAEGVWGSHLIVSVFLPETAPANGIAGTGMPYFSGAFLFFTINIVCIGYFQSLGRFKPATTFMLLRGVVFMIPSFILLPLFIGTNGLWLAVPLSEAVTLLFIILYYLYKNKLETIKNTFMKNLLFGILVPAIFLTACQQQQPETKPAEYAVMTIQTGDVAQTESYSASIQGRQDIEIYPQVSGTIQKVCVKEGQEVNRGQLLFVIDQVPYRAALHTAIANVRSAEAQEQTARLSYNSKKKLHEEEVISEYDLSTARNALSVAEASLEQAKAQEVHARNALSYTEVKSPANGAVGTIPYRVGALVSSTSAQPLTTVSDNSEMYVYFSMSEQQLQSLVRRYGSIRKTVEQMPAVKLQLSDGSVYEKEGRIESISGVLNKQTGSGSLRAVFPNADRVLLSGSTGNVIISHTMHNAISIPQEAAYELQDKQFVFRVVDGKAVSTPIETSPINDGKRYTVTAGLHAGDVIVTTGVGLLKNGDAVTVKK